MEELYGFEEVAQGKRFEKKHRGGLMAVTRLVSADEMAPYLDLLNEIWGFDERQSIPLHEAVVSAITGGLFLSVDFDREPAGIVFVVPAYTREWGYHHHSNFMGFVKSFRYMGLGLEAKKAHALLAAREGVELVTWTFDPLLAPNAGLNFRKLGGICNTVLPDLYGAMGGGFEAGLPTDRFLVQWRINSERVRERLLGEVPSDEFIARRFQYEIAVKTGRKGMTVRGNMQTTASGKILVAIPPGVAELARTNPRAAAAEVVEFRLLMQTLFRKGYQVTEAIRPGIRDEDAHYVLEKEVGL